MIDLNDAPEDHYGHWVYFDGDEDKERALKYLHDWKYFLFKKLPHLKQINDDLIVTKDFNGKSSIGIKIKMVKNDLAT